MKGNKIVIERYLEEGELVDSLDLSVNYLVKHIREGGTVPAKNILVYCTGFDTNTQTPTGVWSVTNTDTELVPSEIKTAVNAQGQTGYINEILGNLYTSVNGQLTTDFDRKYLQVVKLPRVTSIINLTGSFLSYEYSLKEFTMDSLASWDSTQRILDTCGSNTQEGCSISLNSITTLGGTGEILSGKIKTIRMDSLTTITNTNTSRSLLNSSNTMQELYLPSLTTTTYCIFLTRAIKLNFPELVERTSSNSSSQSNEYTEELIAPKWSTSVGAFLPSFSKLREVYLPGIINTNTTIVYQCNAVTSISLPNLETCNMVCQNSNNLVSAYLPKLTSSYNTSVEALFYRCDKLTHVEIPSLEHWDSRNSESYSGLIAYCSLLEEISLPSLTTVYNTRYLINNCQNFRRVTFGGSLTSLNSSYNDINLFVNCRLLESITLQCPSVVYLPRESRIGGTSATAILVPSPLVQSYKSATNWSAKATQIFSNEHDANIQIVDGDESTVEWYNQYPENIEDYKLQNEITLNGEHISNLIYSSISSWSISEPNLTAEVVTRSRSVIVAGTTRNVSLNVNPHNDLQVFVQLSTEWSGSTFNEAFSLSNNRLRYTAPSSSSSNNTFVAKLIFGGSGKYEFKLYGGSYTGESSIWVSKPNVPSYPTTPWSENVQLSYNTVGKYKDFSINVESGDYVWIVGRRTTEFVSWSTLEMQPSYYTDLSIVAEDVNGRATTAPLTYECVGHITPTESMDIEIPETGTGTSSSFPQNTSYTDTVQRTVTFSIHDLTASTTITQGVWFDSTIDVTLMTDKSRYGWTNTDVVAPEGYNIYMSDNYHVSSSQAVMKLTFWGYTDCDIYIRSYAESSWDYTIASQVNAVNYPTSSSGAKAHTSGNQKSGTTLADYTKVSYTGLHDGDYVWIVYVKDGGGDSGDDRGYVLIPQA